MIIPYETEYYEPTKNFIVKLGRLVIRKSRNVGRGLEIILMAFFYIPFAYRSRDEIRRQMYLAGIGSFAVVSIAVLFTGMILALQAGVQLREFGQEARVGTLVLQTLCRELGPIMTAMILASSVGAAITAQIGTMSVSEELAALDVMSIDPVRFLVMPRLIAMLFMCPALTVYACVIGTIGGGIVAESQLDVSYGMYFDNAFEYLKMRDVWVGVQKALVFSVIIVGVSCYQGMATRNGAAGVGKNTRKSVIISILMILVAGYIITRFIYN